MDIAKAAAVLQDLATGTDPITGETLPPNSLYNNPDGIRALFVCIQYIKNPRKPKGEGKMSIDERQANNLDRGLPNNAGLPWTDDLRRKLASDFGAGYSFADLADKFERTKGEIVPELTKQGLISDKY